MGRSRRIYTIPVAAELIGENAELIEEVISNPDNVGYGDIIRIDDGTEDGVEALNEDGVEAVQDLIADIRTWDGGIRAFLIDQHCDPQMIERVMADEAKR